MKRTYWFLFAFFFTHMAVAKDLGGELETGYYLTYLYETRSGYANPNWMEHLPDKTLFSELSIPGTNNSLSIIGGDIPKAQTLSILYQLDMGIRYFDVKFKYRDGILIAYNNQFRQLSTFEEFLNDINTFLTSYPSEFVIIRIKNEAGNNDHSDEYYQRFREVRKNYEHNNFIPKQENFTLGEARGKFIFIRDFKVKSKIGLELNSFFIQDSIYLKNNRDLYLKWDKVKNHFLQLQQTDKSTKSINDLSGFIGAFPYFVASGKINHFTHSPQLLTGTVTSDKNHWPDLPRTNCTYSLCSIKFIGVNQLTYNWIKAQPLDVKLGIVAIDFPGAALVRSIIKNNEKFLLPKNQRKEKPKVIIYSDDNFKGKSVKIFENIASLQTIAMDNKLSSYEISPKYKIIFYENENFEGNNWIRTHRSKDSTSVLFKDRISSIMIVEND